MKLDKNKRILALLAALGGVVLLTRKRDPKKLSKDQRIALVKHLAYQLGIKPSVALAVMEVESGGKAYASDGRMVIRFEPHIFTRKPTKKSRHYQGPNPSVPVKRGQKGEWKTLARAMSVNRSAALKSISMGSAQIMGFNHKRVGHSTVESMWNAYNASEANQIRGFFAFVKSDPKLLKAARTHDWRTFAIRYNGWGGRNTYPPKMKAAWKRWRARGFA